MHAESPRYAHLSFSESKLEILLRGMVESTRTTEAGGGALVAVVGDRVVGMIGGFVTTPFFSEDKIASDYGLYIRPEHRGQGRMAIRLIRAFEKWAAGQGVVEITPGVSTMLNVEGTAGLYELMGYEKLPGCVLRKRLK